MKFVDNIDLGKLELQNARIQNLSSAPSSPVAGQVYFDTTLHQFGVYNDNTTSWVYVTPASGADVSSNTSTSVDGEMALFSGTGGKTIKRSTLTGGVLKSTSGVPAIATEGTDYYKPGGTDVAVADGGTGSSTAAGARTNLGLVIGTDVLAPNGNGSALTGITESQVTNLTTDLAAKAPLASPTFTGTVTVPTPSGGTDAANKNYVDSAVQGLSWKQAARAATTASITTLAGGAPSTLDGVTLALNDRILVKDQATASQNGIYTVTTVGTGVNGTWARATDADSSAELVNATIYVSEGTANADRVWTITTNATITVGTTSITWAEVNGGTVPTASTSTQGKVQLATQAEAQAKTDSAKALTAASVADFARKYTGLIGDGSTTAIAVTHGLGSQYVTAQVFDASTGALVGCDITLTSSTQTTFTFAVAPASNAYRVVITG